MRYDTRSMASEKLVASRVIKMPVGIDHFCYRLAREYFDRRANRGSRWMNARIDQQGPLRIAW